MTEVIHRFQKRYGAKARNITRNTAFGNPHQIGSCDYCKGKHTREEAINLYREYFNQRIQEPGFRSLVAGLRGYLLVCYCSPNPCHGDVIVEWLRRNPEVKP